MSHIPYTRFMACVTNVTTPKEWRAFLRSDEGAVWAYRRWIEAGRKYEPVAAECSVHYNTVRKAVGRGADLVNELAPAPDTSAGPSHLSTGVNQQIQKNDTTPSPNAGGTGEPDGGK